MTRIHVVSLPHTLITRDYDWCAYTAKVRRFVRMLHDAGIEAILYASDVRDPDVDGDCLEYVPVVTAADRTLWFGADEWPRNTVFNRWDADDPAWVTMNQRSALAIRERWQPGDILGLIGGWCQHLIVDNLVDLDPLVCEWGIGYLGVMENTYKVFESYAWMHHVAARRPNDDLHYFDTVIPNCFDVADFIVEKTPGDYLLYMGRPNPRKGLPIIADIAKRVDIPVKIAGQPGDPIPNTEYVGLVTGQEKAELLAGARALLSPTTYLEPFGGVAVEAMLSGTPVIATDYGAFTETVQPGVTGFRCRQLVDFLDAVEQAGDMDRALVAQTATSRYSLQAGSRMYAEYLSRLTWLYGCGWYEGTTEPS